MTLLMTLLSACIAGVIGLLIPGNFRQVSYDLLLTPLYNAFIGVVSTLAGPMIFLSVCWGIYGIGDAATLGKIGKRMLLRYIAFTGIVVIAALCVQLPFAGLQYAYSDIDTSDLTKIVELLLSVFPKNIISPFLDGNTMQIIVMAIAVGSIMLILDNQTNTIAAIIEQANYIIHYLIELISHVIPAFIFIIMLRLIWSDSINQMRTVWKPYITYLLVSTVVVFSIIAFVAYKEKVSIRTLLKKLLPSFLTALSTASSAASFGIAVSTCESELGVNSKVTNFGLPLGIVLFKPIAAVSFLTYALYFTKQYQMSISFIWVISFIIVITILAIALPPLPGGAFACYAILFNQLGLPAEALGIVMILDAFSDFTTTGFDTVLRQCELVLSSDKVNMLNKAKLRKQSAR